MTAATEGRFATPYSAAYLDHLEYISSSISAIALGSSTPSGPASPTGAACSLLTPAFGARASASRPHVDSVQVEFLLDFSIAELSVFIDDGRLFDAGFARSGMDQIFEVPNP